MVQSKQRILVGLAAVICVVSTVPANAQVLEGIRSAVRTPNPSEEPATSRRDDSDYECDDDDSIVEELFGGLVVGIATSPYWGMRMLVDDEGYGPPAFDGIPYAWHAESPWLVQGQNPERLWAWSSQLSLDYIGDFDDLSAIGGRLLIETNSRFGLDTTFRFYDENTIFGTPDELTIGDANIVYRFAQSERLRMRSGVGFSWMNDDAGSNFGFNFTYGGDWFPVNSWIVSTDLDFGRLGNAGLFHLRATVGRQFYQAEIYAGYDLLRVRDTTADGLIVGLRWWF